MSSDMHSYELDQSSNLIPQDSGADEQLARLLFGNDEEQTIPHFGTTQ
jgi:hypothetical protein